MRLEDLVIRGGRLAPLDEFDSAAQWLDYRHKALKAQWRLQCLINVAWIVFGCFVGALIGLGLIGFIDSIRQHLHWS